MKAWLRNFPSAEVRELDPRKHALIEASAGTGKTFAIEHLVLRLLMENPDWAPEEILLLSFTEKTAAELRRRIRDLLHAQARGAAAVEGAKAPITGWSDAERSLLLERWKQADDLAVHTLHAFCQASLRREPLLSGVLIRDEVADDRALADDALENLLRGPWARDPERLARLRDALGIGDGDGWREKLAKLTLAWHPWRGDRIAPERDPGAADLLEQALGPAVLELIAALETIEQSSFTRARHREAFTLSKSGRPRKNWEEDLRKDAFEKVFRFEEEHEPASRKHAEREALVLRFFRTAFTKASVVVTRGWISTLHPAAAGLPEWIRLCEACTVLRDLAERLEDARRLRALGLLAESARELRAELWREKRSRGVISYDDMPANLAQALRKSPDLAARLRRRYKACIVDEFQDTDPVQWNILEALCLEESDTAPGNPSLSLFLVGDPKQAIYGFRGGDLRTYLAARRKFHAMAAAQRAQGFGLDANFRSHPTLIQGLNAVFAHPDWFGNSEALTDDPAWHLPAGSEDVSFLPARAGRGEAADGPRIHLRDFGAADAGSGKGAKVGKAAADRAVRRWIASRIVTAITKGRAPGEIAVLVRKNAEGEAIERLLRRRGVPCRVRRRGGVFVGAAADAVRLLLEWIEDAASPEAQARILLLPFARAGAADLPRGLPDACPPLITRWAALARAGRWPEFFEAVGRDGGYRERLAQDSPSEAERFGRLARLLSEAGSAPGMTTRMLRDRFDALRLGEGNDEEGGADTGAGGAVSLMTLHMSKGLEFPVVFVAASGEGVRSDYFVLRPRNEVGFLIALDKQDPEARNAHAAEERGEEKRLFYVALTRAREELHLPLLPVRFAGSSAGPMGGFAATALRDAATSEKTAVLFRWDVDPVSEAPLPAPSNTPDHAASEIPPDRNLLLEETRKAFARRRILASYSALAHRTQNAMPQAATARIFSGGATDDLVDDNGTRVRREEPEASAATEDGAPAARIPDGITALELPAGAESGTALHAILEHTVFASVLEAENPGAWLENTERRARIEEALRREAVDDAYASAAGRAVWNTLRMPLPDPAGGPAFRLSELADPDDYRHEVEFLLPFAATAGDARASLPEGVSRRGTFLWGFIDLVFRRNGRYYLLDWKSNLLPSYDEASVRRSMEERRYDLQWKLYAVALDRWLAARLPGYDPEAHFGGVHYLYLRGATPERFSGFVARPTVRQLREDFPAEIARLLGGNAEEAA